MKKSLNGKVRPARLDEIAQIYQVIRENPDEVLPRSIPELLQNFDRFLVYEEAGEIKGVISWQVLPSLEPEDERILEIVSFSVRKKDQRKGIGSLLLQEMLEKLRHYHPDRILVLTFYPEFFKKFGFRRVSKKKLYPKIYLGCFKCTKYTSPLTCPEVAMVKILKKEEKK